MDEGGIDGAESPAEVGSGERGRGVGYPTAREREHHGSVAVVYRSVRVSVNSGEEISSAAPAGVPTRILSITSPALLPTSYLGSYSVSVPPPCYCSGT